MVHLKYAIDMLLATVAIPLAFWFRLESLDALYFDIRLYGTGSFVIKIFILSYFGLHRQSWSKFSVRDGQKVIGAASVMILALLALGFFLKPYIVLPRSIPLLDGIFCLLSIGGVRFFARTWNDRIHFRHKNDKIEKVLFVGLEESAILVAQQMLRHPEAGLRPVGFLAIQLPLKNQTLMGLPILGGLEHLSRIVCQMEVEVLAVSTKADNVLQQVRKLSREGNVKYRLIPDIGELLEGKAFLENITDMNVFLRREPVSLDDQKISSYLVNQVVLVTGAGGSIGSEIVRQVARYHPQNIILLGRGENSLYQIEQELKWRYPKLSYSTIVADIRNLDKMGHIFDQYQPQVVFHAAAHKHVPMMEINPDEAILNNVQGTQNLLELCLKKQVRHFVHLSTDKAVHPSSVMGISKRLAEYLIQKTALRAQAGQFFTVVRFGNVLGSRGSVIPLFQEQIKHGGPVTVTHPDMTRYFMTIPEAAQLVVQAGGLNSNGTLFVLDMGKQVKILDLACEIIRLAGLEPHKDIPIVFTGTRPGEKLEEELLMEGEEKILDSPHPKIRAISGHLPPENLETLLEELYALAHKQEKALLLARLQQIFPTYHSEQGRVEQNIKI